VGWTDFVAVRGDGVQFVDEDDRGCGSLRRSEQSAQLVLRLAVVHAHHLGAVDGVERRGRLVGDGSRDQRLACARRTVQQDAASWLQHHQATVVQSSKAPAARHLRAAAAGQGWRGGGQDSHQQTASHQPFVFFLANDRCLQNLREFKSSVETR